MADTPKSSNNNGELHDLRYRISQLEHLFVNASINSNPFLPPNEGNDPYSISSSASSELRSIQTQHELISRIGDLEGLLAASELENQHLRQELSVLDMDKKRDDVILLEKLYGKDKQVQRLENDVRLLQTKLEKAERMMENVKEYINTLPAQDELDEAKETVVRLESDNHVLRQKGAGLEGLLEGHQKELREKSKLVEEQKIRLEELQPLEEAQTSILQSTEEGSLDLQNEKYILELITVQKAQILRSAKMISTLRDKLNQCQSEKNDLREKMTSQGKDIERLQEEQLVNQLTMEKTTQKLKMAEQENLSLFDDKAQLQSALENREKFIRERDTQFSNIIKLVTEIDLCVNDVRKLVELGESIAKGEEPAVASLLGLSDELEMHLQSLHEDEMESRRESLSNCEGASVSINNSLVNNYHHNSSSRNEHSLVGRYLASINNGTGATGSEEFSLGDMEWVLDRIKKIKDLRQNIGCIRDQVNDIYTDMLGSKTEGCNVQ